MAFLDQIKGDNRKKTDEAIFMWTVLSDIQRQVVDRLARLTNLGTL